MKATRTAPSRCWLCGAEFDAAADMFGDNKPSSGDVSICVKCGMPGIFKEDLTTREPTLQEMRNLLRSPDVVSYILAIRSLYHEKMMKKDKMGNWKGDL